MSAVTEKNKIETQYCFGELFSKHLSMYSMTREFIFSFKACVEAAVAAVANKCQIVLISCVCVWEGAESNHLFCHEEKNKNKQISLTCEEKQKRGSCLPRQCRVSKSVNTGSRQYYTEYSRQFVWNPSSNSNTLPPKDSINAQNSFFLQTGILNSDPTIFLHPIHIFCVTQSNLSFSSLLSDKSCRQIPQILIFPNPVSKHPVGVSFDKISRKGIHRKAHNSIRID